MKFGIFYEHQLPRPWNEGRELALFQEALDQVELADRLGLDYAWEVEHHFLEEYSHCSAPEVFLAAAAARTKTIRLGHGIRQVIPNYNHPARTAEGLGRARSSRACRGLRPSAPGGCSSGSPDGCRGRGESSWCALPRPTETLRARSSASTPR